MPTQAVQGQSCAHYPDTQLSLLAQVETPTQQHPAGLTSLWEVPGSAIPIAQSVEGTIDT